MWSPYEYRVLCHVSVNERLYTIHMIIRSCEANDSLST